MPESNTADFSNDGDERNAILERTAYLATEAEMLNKVINQVPYDEQPPQKPSILQLLDRIRQIQESYFLPLFTRMSGQSVDYPSIEEWYERKFDDNSGQPEREVQQILQEISRHREEVLNKLGKLQTKDWEKVVKHQNQERRIRELIEDIVDFERSILSQISDQVMVYSQQRSTQREIENRKKQRPDQSDQGN